MELLYEAPVTLPTRLSGSLLHGRGIRIRPSVRGIRIGIVCIQTVFSVDIHL